MPQPSPFNSSIAKELSFVARDHGSKARTGWIAAADPFLAKVTPYLHKQIQAVCLFDGQGAVTASQIIPAAAFLFGSLL